MCPNTDFFWSFSSRTRTKKNPYLGTFHAMKLLANNYLSKSSILDISLVLNTKCSIKKALEHFAKFTRTHFCLRKSHAKVYHKNMPLKMSQNSQQKNKQAEVSFSMKLQAGYYLFYFTEFSY